jgi:hypothetical protein
MKRFLLGTLGTMGLAGCLAQAPATEPYQLPRMPYPSVPGVPPNEFAASPSPTISSPPEDRKGDGGWHFYGGAEALLLRPYFSSNPALTVTSTAITGTGALNATEDLDYEFDLAQRYWIGAHIDEGLGVRGRWLRLDYSADPRISANAADVTRVTTATSTAIGGAAVTNAFLGTSTVGGVTSPVGTGQVLSVNGGLELDVWDAEFTATCRRGCWELTTFAGARYTYLEQSYLAISPGVPNTDGIDGVVVGTDVTRGVLQSRQTFNGAGPTLGLEALRQVGDSGFSLYGSGRGAVLFGRGRQQTTFNTATAIDPLTGAPPIGFDFVSVTNEEGFDVLSVAELELGVQWGRKVGDFEVFVRPSVVSHFYFDGGSSSSRSGDFGLFGGALAAGLRY